MAAVQVDFQAQGARADTPDPRPATSGSVEIEREVTRRHLIDAVTRVVLVVLYMAFSMFRERRAAVVPLRPADDWAPPADPPAST